MAAKAATSANVLSPVEHKASTCFFVWGVEHRQFNRTRPGIGCINPQRAFDRYGHLGLRRRHLFNVQTLGRNRHRTFASKAVYPLGAATSSTV